MAGFKQRTLCFFAGDPIVGPAWTYRTDPMLFVIISFRDGLVEILVLEDLGILGCY
jgi:hypothetical protein